MEETTTAITAVKREVDWAARIEAQQTSGMTVQKWCEEISNTAAVRKKFRYGSEKQTV